MPTSILPLVMKASAVWAGNDGNWSTFFLQAGGSQSFHVLPSTSHGEVWIPGPQGCASRSVPLECAASRGVGFFEGSQSLGFQENASSTWEQIGIYEFITGGDLFQETETGLYGLDDVVIGNNGTSVVKHQTVASIVTEDFWLGSFGLNQIRSEFPVRSESLPSLLDGMKDENITSSASFGLAVGAAYSMLISDAVLFSALADISDIESSAGSLVIGGYDQGLFQVPSVEIPVAGNDTRSLVVNVQSIVATNTLNGTLSAAFDLPNLPMAIDSGVSQLWLPLEVCDQLASALGLTYDSSTELYLVNDTARSKLLDLSPEITFTVAANSTSHETVNIALPYAALDLTIGQPFYNTSKHYFPIRRAPSDTLYVLGRAFLQEAYLVVDWERGNFTVSQANHGGTGQHVVAILPPDSESAKHTGLSSGVIAGIIVGVSLGVIAAAVAAYVLWRKNRSRELYRQEVPSSPYPEDKREDNSVELPGVGTIVAEASSNPIHELHQDSPRQQLMSTPIYELPGERVEKELDTDTSPGEPGKGEGNLKLPKPTWSP